MPKLVQPVQWGEDNSVDAVPELTEEDRHEIQRRIQILDKALSDKKKAKYKLELMFTQSRSTWKPVRGVLSFWESGAKLHGGGDTKLYICPGKTLGRSGCEAFIPDMSQGYGHLLCPTCGTAWEGSQVLGEIIANNTPRNWAELLLKYFAKLGYNADIYLKHAPDDIRSIAMVEQEKQHHGDRLQKMRQRRALHMYPLVNIVKDTAAGADLLGRLYAFLVS